MRILLQALLHGLCGIAGFWLVASPDHAETSADSMSSPKAASTQIQSDVHSASLPHSASEPGLALLTPENWAEALSPLSQMRLEELPLKLRDLLHNPFPDVKRRLLHGLFTRWAELDHAGALAAMRGLSSPQHKQSALRAILSIWTKTHEEAAWQYVTALEDDSVLQEAGIEILLGLNLGADPLHQAAWAAQLDDVFLREKALVQIGDRWMQDDPQGALAAAGTVEPKRLRDHLLAKVCYREGVDHTAGLETVAQLPTRAERSWLSAEWLGAFAHDQPQEAFQWLLAHADRTELQKSANTLGGILAVQTPTIAALRAMALQLPAGPLRDAFTARAAEEWTSAGRSLAGAENLLTLCGPCLERESAQDTIRQRQAAP